MKKHCQGTKPEEVLFLMDNYNVPNYPLKSSQEY